MSDMVDDFEAHFEPFRFFGIDCQRNIAPCRGFAQRQQQIRQHRHALVPMRHFIARMERGKLDRNRMPGPRGLDRREIGCEIALPVLVGARRFPQHVETGCEPLIFGAGHALGRFLDRAAHDEDFAHHPHCGADRLPDERFSHPGDQAAERAGLFLLADQCTADHQSPSGRVDERRLRPARMRPPIGLAQLVGDQRIRCLRVRNAQERLRQRKQSHSLMRVQPVFLEELVDPARALRRAKVSNQFSGTIDDAFSLVGRGSGAVQERGKHFGFGCAVKLTHDGRCGIHDL